MPQRPKTTDGTAASRSIDVAEALGEPARRVVRDEERDADRRAARAMIRARSGGPDGAEDSGPT